MEEWRDVVGFEDYYQVSSLGRVRGKDRLVRHSGTFERIQCGKIIKTHVNKRLGYVYVNLHKYGKSYPNKVHRLAAMAFIDNPENKPEVNHLDEDKENNAVSNLEWATRKENENYGTKRARCKAHMDYAALAEKNKKPVAQYSISGELIKIWDSLADLHRATGYSQGNVSMSCTGKYKKPLYGCVWRYV